MSSTSPRLSSPWTSTPYTTAGVVVDGELKKARKFKAPAGEVYKTLEQARMWSVIRMRNARRREKAFKKRAYNLIRDFVNKMAHEIVELARENQAEVWVDAPFDDSVRKLYQEMPKTKCSRRGCAVWLGALKNSPHGTASPSKGSFCTRHVVPSATPSWRDAIGLCVVKLAASPSRGTTCRCSGPAASGPKGGPSPKPPLFPPRACSTRGRAN